MSFSGLNSSALWSATQVSGNTAVGGASGGCEGAGGEEGGKVHHHGHGGGGMMKDVMQALSDMGLTSDASSSSTTATTAATSTDGSTDGSTASGDPSQAQQAMHQFMHDLFHAMHSAQAGQPASSTDSGSTATAPASPYGNMENALQSMIGSLSSGASASGALGKLQTDFQHLVTSMGGSTPATGTDAGSADAANSQATLQAFLAKLEQQMAGHQTPMSPVGNNVSTQV